MNTQFQAYGHRRQRVGYIVLSLQRHLHREGQPSRFHGKAKQAVLLAHIQRPNRTFVIGAEVGNPLLGHHIQIPQHGVVTVEQQHPLGRHALQNFKFRLTDALLGA